jgi:hypothetical protein
MKPEAIHEVLNSSALQGGGHKIMVLGFSPKCISALAIYKFNLFSLPIFIADIHQ